MKKRKPKKPKSVRDAERTIASNPLYKGLTIVEATRQMLRGSPKSAVK